MGKASLTIFRPNQPGKLSRRLSRNFWKNMLVKSLPSTFTRFKRWTRPAGRPWMKSFPATPASPFERRGKKDGFHHRGTEDAKNLQGFGDWLLAVAGGARRAGAFLPMPCSCRGNRICFYHRLLKYSYLGLPRCGVFQVAFPRTLVPRPEGLGLEFGSR